VNERIQQHTAIHYNSRLRWTATNLRLHQIATHYFSSPSVAKCSLSAVTAVCVHSFDCFEGVWGKEEFGIYGTRGG